MAPLLNTLAKLDQYLHSPSRADGIPRELEEELRCYGCQLIQQAGILMELPQRTMATAQVLFQRFWFVSSMRAYCIRDIAMGGLFLSTKLEETPIRLRDLINVFDYLIKRALHSSKYNPAPRIAREKKQQSNGKQKAEEQESFEYEPLSYHQPEFYDMKDDMVIAEMQILKRLGFNVQVNLPYATMVNYLQLLGMTDTERYAGVAQQAWSLLNDSLQTPLYCLFPPHAIACAAIYLAAATSDPPISLPLEPAPWFRLFDVEEEELRVMCAHILYLYDEKEGLASRVREEWGGMAELVRRTQVRNWLAEHAKVEEGEQGQGQGVPLAPAKPWVLQMSARDDK